MSTAPAPSTWADLPFDLLLDVSGRLHAAADYVRFHAVCTPWRDTLPPPPRRPAFLPWLIAPRDATGHRRARCVLSSCSSSGGRRRRADVLVRDRRWVIRADDGAAAAALLAASPGSSSGGGDADPLAGSSAAAAPLPPLPAKIDAWVDHAFGSVSGDGSIFLCAIEPKYESTIALAHLQPSDTAWTSVQRNSPCSSWWEESGSCCTTCHGGEVVHCSRFYWSSMASAQAVAFGSGDRRRGYLPREPGKDVQYSYMVESRGELLGVFVHVKRPGSSYVIDVVDVDAMASALSVSVYVLQDAGAGDGDQPRWVKRDDAGESLADRVFFLGWPCSFAVDASRIGVDGGCAYFLLRSKLYGGAWSKLPLMRCRLFKYRFGDDSAEFVEQLPGEWSDQACMWLRPQPTIAPTEEIRERLEASNGKATKDDDKKFRDYFRIYVGNLPRKLDSYRLRQFFSKHGKVADASVINDKKTRRSRGFGFVTMATVDDEPAHAIAKLHGQCLEGRPLRVKLADQERQSC
ncbi:hypothetical protein ACP4OV_015005 [Aristida adscensionis]